MRELLDDPRLRQVRRRLAVLYLICAVFAFGVHFVIEAMPEANDYLMMLVPVLYLIPIFVILGYAFTLPLLWFRGTLLRYTLAFLLPLSLWVVFSLGMLLAFGWEDSLAEEFPEITVCLMTALTGGAIPIAAVIGWGRWRLSCEFKDPIPIGINDLMVLSAFIAVLFGSMRQISFGTEEVEMVFMALFFYGLIGAFVMTSLLLAMRMMLIVDNHPINKFTVAGLGVTGLMTLGIWAMLFFLSDGIFANDPLAILHVSLCAAATWLVAAGSAAAIGWWLRSSGIRLSTAKSVF